LNCTHEAERTPFQTQYFSENLVALGSEPGTSAFVARNSDHYTTEAAISTGKQSKREGSRVVKGRGTFVT
jgi:hypothetical protein